MAGAVCYGAILLKGRLGYDDSLDVVGVHGVGGIIGALVTGLFATVAVNAAGADGLFYGNPMLFAKQALAAGVSLALLASSSAPSSSRSSTRRWGCGWRRKTSGWGWTSRSTGRRGTTGEKDRSDRQAIQDR